MEFEDFGNLKNELMAIKFAGHRNDLELITNMYNELAQTLPYYSFIHLEKYFYILACELGNFEVVSWFLDNNDDLKYEADGFFGALHNRRWGGDEELVVSLILEKSPLQYYYNDDKRQWVFLTKEETIALRQNILDNKIALASFLHQKHSNKVLANEDLVRTIAEYL